VRSAKDATEWLRDVINDPVDINGLQINGVSAEEEEAFNHRKEFESRLAEEEHAERLAGTRGRSSEELRQKVDKVDIQITVDPRLHDEQNRGIASAIKFVDTLKESVANPTGYPGELSEAGALDKLIHIGWSEHDDLERAFKSAAKVESRIKPAMTSENKKHYAVEIVFTDQEGKQSFFDTNFNEDGEIEAGIARHSDFDKNLPPEKK
jgi:hypothetical protein